MKIFILVLICIITSNGVINAQNDSIPVDFNKYEVFSSKGFKGLKYDGEVVLNAEYIDIIKPSKFEDFIILKYPDFLKLYMTTTSKILNIEISSVKLYSTLDKGYYLISKGEGDNKRHGIIDKYGKLIIPMQFTFFNTSFNNRFFAKTEEGNFQLFSLDGRFLYEIGTYWRYIRTEINQYIGEPIVESIIKQDGGVLYQIKITDMDGKLIYTSPTDYYVTRYSFFYGSGCMISYHKKTNKVGVLSIPDGNIVIEPSYHSLVWFTKDLLIAENNNVRGLINFKDEEVLPFVYDFISPRTDEMGVAKSTVDGYYYAINSRGQIAFSMDNYTDVSVNSFCDGLCFVAKNNKWGVIDTTGMEVLSCEFDDYIAFENGIAFIAVRENRRLFYTTIDKKGKPIIDDFVFEITTDNNGEAIHKYFFGRKFLKIKKDGYTNLIDLETGKLFGNNYWSGPEQYIFYNSKDVFAFTPLGDGTILINLEDKGWVRMDSEGEIISLLDYQKLIEEREQESIRMAKEKEENDYIQMINGVKAKPFTETERDFIGNWEFKSSKIFTNANEILIFEEFYTVNSDRTYIYKSYFRKWLEKPIYTEYSEKGIWEIKDNTFYAYINEEDGKPSKRIDPLKFDNISEKKANRTLKLFNDLPPIKLSGKKVSKASSFD